MPHAPRASARRAAAEEASAALASRRLRAASEPLDLQVRATEPFLELEVRNPVHQTRYRVFLPEYPGRDAALCTCTDFARRGLGTCKHLEAAWSWLGALHGALPAPTRRSARSGPGWEEVERRAAQRGPGAPTSIRELAAVGAVLLEVDGKNSDVPRGGTREGVDRPTAGRASPTSTSPERP